MGRRIALVTSSYHPHLGGVEEHVRHVARQLRADGHDVVVWTVDRGEHLGTQRLDGIEVRYLPTPLPARSVGALARFAKDAPGAWHAWARAFRDARPEVLHVQCFGPNGLYAWALHRRHGTPLIVSSHGETFADDHGVFQESALARRGLRQALQDASAITGVSTVVLDDLTRFGMPRGEVVPNGIDPDVQLCERTSDTTGEPVVFALGRLERNKGFDLLIRAFAGSPASRTARLAIAGSGSERDALETLVAREGVTDRVELLGRLDSQQVAAQMTAAAVVVVPSRVEAFGIVALEAWRAGAPLVMTSRGGATDFVTDGFDALLVDPGRVDELGAAICRVLDDPALAARLGEAGRAKVQDLTWSRVAMQYAAIYDAVTT